MFGVAEAAYLLDDVETAARVYELLGPYADLPVVASLGALCLGSVEHVLGVAALTVGDLDGAVAHFADAIRGNLALRHWPAVIGSRARYAQALARRGDAAPARDALAIARQEAAITGVPVPEHAAERPGGVDVASCVRSGQQWLVRYGRRRALVRHSVGMAYLAVLLANPGRDVSAVDLAAGLSGLHRAAAEAQPVLDRVAVERYRERVEELRARIDRLKSDGRSDQAAEATAERDWLLAELASAAGLAGRARAFSNEHERARLAVGKAIRRTVAAVDRVDAVIGAHLHSGLHTGVRCSYRPS
jgi:hypothetical protein